MDQGSLPVWIGVLALIGATIAMFVQSRISRQDAKDDLDTDIESLALQIDKTDIGLATIRETYMSHKEHELVCKNSSLEINAHITHELSALKDDVFTSFRTLEGKMDKALSAKPNGEKEITDRLTVIEKSLKQLTEKA